MQSPFKIFRRFQKVLLAIAALMAILAFGLLEPLTQMVRSVSGGRDGSVVVESNVGNLSENGLRELRHRRSIANRFVYSAFVTANPKYAQIAQYMPGKVQRFGSDQPRDVYFAWLMRAEARRLGIVVDNNQIDALIAEISSLPGGGGDKLSSDQFQKIVKELQISAKQLYDILREEVAWQTAFNLTFPVSTLAPEQYWKIYQQLNARQTIDVAPLPVKDFVAKVDTPSAGLLTRYFESHKTTFDASVGGEYKPGFRQPTKAALHYLEISYAAVKQQVAEDFPITDKDIESYYEAKKAIDLRFQEMDTGPRRGSDSSPIDPDFAPHEGGRKRGPALEPGAGPDDPAESASEGEKRPEPPATPSEESALDAESDAESDPVADPKSTESPCGPANEAEVPKSFDEGAIVTDEDPVKGKPVRPQSETDEPGDADAPTADDGDSTDKPKEEEEEPSAPEDDDLAPPATNSGRKPPKAPPRPVKYKPLDDALRDEIRDSIIHERTVQRMKDLSAKAAQELHAAGLKLSQRADLDLTKLKPRDVEELAKSSRDDMEKIASKYGLKFGETGLVSERELSELPGIGKAQEPDATPFMDRRVRTIVNMAFGSDSLCSVQEAESSVAAESRDLYVFWKVQHVSEHVPTFDEPGVKDQVIEAWKLSQAVDLAKNRAEQLAELVRQGKQTMGEVLSGQTVTGAAQGLKLSIYRSPEFSWWRESTAPQPGMGRPEVELSNPVVVNNPGRKFMEYVFDDLNDGDVGMAPNNDASVFYVVKVVSRRPADREAFKNAPLFGESSQYSQLAAIEQQATRGEFYQDLEKRYAVKWREPEAAPGRSPAVEEDE
ncbi:MAG: hypothetical protein EXS05_00375 [Planctomycetaceae bacterium]|nr:hypothetical protein [Planctomycetaceae bacterium]